MHVKQYLFYCLFSQNIKHVICDIYQLLKEHIYKQL